MLFGKKSKEKEYKKGKKAFSCVAFRNKPVLGIPLHEAVKSNKSHDGVLVPVIVRLCIDYVNEHGLHSEGIYRISCPKTKLDELEKMANEYGWVYFDEANEAAGLLKRFLRQLPEHILTNQYLNDFDRISSLCTCDFASPCCCSVTKMLRDLLNKIPKENYYLLAYVFLHAQRVVMMSTENKMNVPALGVLLQAILNLPRNTVRIFLLNASSLLNTTNIKVIFIKFIY
uniref:Rho-GAP domain-containing protein n=1 Tax=Parastrongyloides trichosuri TaxID=131310 RepID=A0A0N4ZN45_PARTI